MGICPLIVLMSNQEDTVSSQVAVIIKFVFGIYFPLFQGNKKYKALKIQGKLLKHQQTQTE
jgi:hypothetical protein